MRICQMIFKFEQESAISSLREWLSDAAIGNNPVLRLIAGIIYMHEQDYNEALKHTNSGGTMELLVSPIPFLFFLFIKFPMSICVCVRAGSSHVQFKKVNHKTWFEYQDMQSFVFFLFLFPFFASIDDELMMNKILVLAPYLLITEIGST